MLGVGGGIAAAQVPSLLLYLRAAGYQSRIHVVLTAAAERLVATAALLGCGAERVYTPVDLFPQGSGVPHVELARLADVIVVHPATADLIARLAHGRADDLLTSLILASRAPVVVSPAMNLAMWEKAAVQRNVQQLRSDGLAVIEPELGVEAHDAQLGGAVSVSPLVLLDAIRAALLGR